MGAKMAARSRNRLSAAFVAKKDLKPGRYGDGANLYLNVTPTKTKNWVMIINRGVRREIGLGSVLDVSLEKARVKADAFRRAAADGRDVLEVKRTERSVLNFEQAAKMFVAAKKDGWKHENIENRWAQILALKEVADLNLRPVRDVVVQDVLRAVTPLWQSKPTTGKFLVGMIKQTLAFANANGHRDPNVANPADWNTSLKYLMSSPKRGGNFAAMDYNDVPSFVQSLREQDTAYARAIEFLVLTWARKQEVLDLDWNEIDFDKALWTVPAARMKMGILHQVGLSARALEILREQHKATGGKGLVFPATTSNKPISRTTLNRLVPRPYTLHGFRSAARDYTGDKTDIPREIAEGCLAHSIGSASERAYRRGNALEKRRQCLTIWADYLATS